MSIEDSLPIDSTSEYSSESSSYSTNDLGLSSYFSGGSNTCVGDSSVSNVTNNQLEKESSTSRKRKRCMILAVLLPTYLVSIVISFLIGFSFRFNKGIPEPYFEDGDLSFLGFNNVEFCYVFDKRDAMVIIQQILTEIDYKMNGESFQNQYSCSGSCFCGLSERRRNSGILTKGVTSIITSLTTLYAIKTYQDSLNEQCVLEYSSDCDVDSIHSEVDECSELPKEMTILSEEMIEDLVLLLETGIEDIKMKCEDDQISSMEELQLACDEVGRMVETGLSHSLSWKDSDFIGTLSRLVANILSLNFNFNFIENINIFNINSKEKKKTQNPQNEKYHLLIQATCCFEESSGYFGLIQGGEKIVDISCYQILPPKFQPLDVDNSVMLGIMTESAEKYIRKLCEKKSKGKLKERSTYIEFKKGVVENQDDCEITETELFKKFGKEDFFGQHDLFLKE